MEDKIEDDVVENICETPGMKIRSKGQGRGLGIGKGKGPIGRMGVEEGKDRVGRMLGKMLGGK